MSTYTYPRRPSSNVSIVAVLAAVVMGGWFLAPAGHTQAPAAPVQNPALANLLAKLKTQQTLIIANQTKIEAQTALLKEELRQAKIYSARGGSGHR